MADIKGFRALRYDLNKAGKINELITPPYDVINDKMQEDFYQASPYNIIRLEWGKKYPDDTPENNRYTRAAADFKDWQEQGILKRDPNPAFYFYRQEFSFGQKTYIRSGFLAAIKAEGYENGNVLPHEETLPKHKEDRYKLMEHTYANFSPILGLYAQKEQTIDAALGLWAEKNAPQIDFKDPQGVTHRLWHIDDPATVALVEKEFKELKVYIADGHHRYETASLFAKNAAQKGKENCAYMLIALINLYDAGLLVLPTHRLVKNLNGLTGNGLLSKIAEAGFTVMRITDGNKAGALEALLTRMEKGGKEIPSFGLYIEDEFYLIQLPQGDKFLAEISPDKSLAYRNLDVTILHSLILENILDICPEKLAAEGYIGYTRDNKDTFEKIDSGEYACAFLLNSTHIRELLEVADAGDKMPQKSTYFYPKIIAGLAVNKLGQ